MMFAQWFAKYPRLARHGLAAVSILVGAVITAPITYYVTGLMLTAVIIGTTLTTLVFLFLGYYFVTGWYLEFRERLGKREVNRIFFDQYVTALEFAYKRRDVLLSLKPETMRYEIFSTSKCNLFANPDGLEDELAQIKKVNEEFFIRVAQIATAPKSNAPVRLLLQAESHDQSERELLPRINIFSSVQPQWNTHHFEVRMLADKSVQDFLVVEDHIFHTIRRSNPKAVGARYVHIQSEHLAQAHREWLRDLFHNGHFNGYVEDPTVTMDWFESLIKQTRSPGRP